MILNEVINSGTLPQKKFVVRSEEDYESLQCKTMKTNLFQGQLGRRSSGIACPHFRNNDTRPAKFLLFSDYKGRLSGWSRVRGYQTGTGGVNLQTHSTFVSDRCPEWPCGAANASS